MFRIVCVLTLLSMTIPPSDGACGEPGALMEPLIHVTRFGFVEAMTDSWESNQHEFVDVCGKTNLIHITNRPAFGNYKVYR